MAVPIKQLKPGNAYAEGNDLFLCISNEQNKQARLSGQYKVKRSNMRTGAVTDTTYNPTEKVEIVMIDKSKKQYLYDDGSNLVFMDNETYDQAPLNKSDLGDTLKYLKENMEVTILSFKGKVFAVEPPIFVELEVTYTEPGFAGNTTTTSGKPATLETGLELQVPMFVNIGDVLRIDTRTCEYMERV